ncbi:uncharacterized membrane protein HdeD (DUF308 family) [Allocatelliglobosispora scoriae]|uniref:Uncharacterized membrane protein HdeD (DUF308 family) n=1 Tax=Allocatelliglobosispora scoriae TaxID=643052 RepID=A0A841BPI3_9ACTN|nr:DUF308 domain-containing protein [Allocatelliglobosispora scoriae]MBB5870184.1 uncharacterized membrane protein HdeD (DUF308 family) [Allocatelliglobosispora scoriae]
MSDAATGRQAGKWWWVFLITGVLWLILSLIILRFNAASIATVATLFGCVAIAAGVNEFVIASVTTSWRWLHIALGVLFVITGVICLFNPGNTFWALASLMGWFLLFKGTFDIVTSVLTRKVNELWWLGLIAGILEIMIAFWAAGGFGRKAILLLVWASVAAMFRGITEIVTAFRLRSESKDGEDLVEKAAQSVRTPPRRTTPRPA